MKRFVAYSAMVVGLVWLLGWCLQAWQIVARLISDERFRQDLSVELIDIAQFRFRGGNLVYFVAGVSSIYAGWLVLRWGTRNRASEGNSLPLPSGDPSLRIPDIAVGSGSLFKQILTALKPGFAAFAQMTGVAFGTVMIAAIVFNGAKDLWRFIGDPAGLAVNKIVIGPVGMDDTGRYWLCRHFDNAVRPSVGFLIQCEGDHVNTVVVKNTKKDRSAVEQELPVSKRMENISAAMQDPYDPTILDGLERLALTGDRDGWKRDREISKQDFLRKLNQIGVRTAGDFYAACGFTKFEVRDQDETKLSLTFSAAAMGRNPMR
jgi:hypothetical protein